MQENLYCENYMHQSAAHSFEAYLEQSFPAPPPCMPTILHEFLVDLAVLKGERRDSNRDISHLYLKCKQ